MRSRARLTLGPWVMDAVSLIETDRLLMRQRLVPRKAAYPLRGLASWNSGQHGGGSSDRAPVSCALASPQRPAHSALRMAYVRDMRITASPAPSPGVSEGPPYRRECAPH